MRQAPKITPDEVKHIASLAKIPVSLEEIHTLAKAFEETLDVVGNLKKAETKGVEPTYQVTGTENIMREDVVDDKHMLSQDEALRNAKRTYKGFFVVDQVLVK